MYRLPIFNPWNELCDFTYQISNTYPASNNAEVRSTDNGFAVDILLPGFTKEEVEVKVEGDDLIIEAKTERKFPNFLSNHIKRTYEVRSIDSESIKGGLENGILNLEFSTAKKKNHKLISLS